MILRLLVCAYTLGCMYALPTQRSVALFLTPCVAFLWLAWHMDSMARFRMMFRWWTFLFFSIWSFTIVSWYVQLGIQASRKPWGVFPTDTAAAGMSSCCRTEGVDYPYHPAGYFTCVAPFVTGTIAPTITTCPMPGGRWADSTDVPPIGYEADSYGNVDVTRPCVDGLCQQLASRRVEDHPDLGKGLTNGITLGTAIAPRTLCPGVANVLNSLGKLGKGLEICSRCSTITPEHCEQKSEARALCFMCPGGFYTNEPVQSAENIRLTAELLFGQWFVVMFATSLSIECGVKYPVGYSPLF